MTTSRELRVVVSQRETTSPQGATLRKHMMTRHIIQTSDLTRPDVDALYSRADSISNSDEPNLSGATVACALFNTSFPLPVRAEEVLTNAQADGQTISVRDIKNSSEIANAINAIEPQAVLFSHPQAGFAQEIARLVHAPLLNAGDGTYENPVRALMDACAIRRLKGNPSNLRVAILGNLKFGAEAHSLARLLSQFDVHLSLVTPAALSMPYDLTDDLRATGIEVEETNDLATTLKKSDVLYLAGIDPIRVEKKLYDKLKNFYALSDAMIADAKPGLVILGEWDGADALLAPMRPVVERAARDVLVALVEQVIAKD